MDRDETWESDICDSIYVHGFGFASWTQILNNQVRGSNSSPLDGYDSFEHPAFWRITQAKAYLATIMNPYFYWSCQFRPVVKKTIRLHDAWGLSGFIRRTADMFERPLMAEDDRVGFFYMQFAVTESGVLSAP